MSEYVDVEVECPCEGAPHDTDTVSLHPAVTLPMGAASFAMMDVGEAADTAELLGLLAPIYLHFGIAAWTLVDADGKALPVNRRNIDERLTWHFAWPVIRKANDLYPAEVASPLQPRRSPPSKHGPTDDSTSPIPLSGRKHPAPSKPSSRPASEDGRQSEDRAS